MTQKVEAILDGPSDENTPSERYYVKMKMVNNSKKVLYNDRD